MCNLARVRDALARVHVTLAQFMHDLSFPRDCRRQKEARRTRWEMPRDSIAIRYQLGQGIISRAASSSPRCASNRFPFTEPCDIPGYAIFKHDWKRGKLPGFCSGGGKGGIFQAELIFLFTRTYRGFHLTWASKDCAGLPLENYFFKSSP